MIDLNSIKGLVKAVLIADITARNDDNYLYFRILRIMAKRKGIDVRNMPVGDFLLSMNANGLPQFETVRRARQKVQNEFPELSANAVVKKARAEKQEAYLEYVRGCTE